MTQQIDFSRVVCTLHEITNPGSRAFLLGAGDWPLRGFVVRHGARVVAYVNRCPHAGHPLNWRPDRFLTADHAAILCQSHGALFDIATGACLAGPCAGRGLKEIPVRVIGEHVVLEHDANVLARDNQ